MTIVHKTPTLPLRYAALVVGRLLISLLSSSTWPPPSTNSATWPTVPWWFAAFFLIAKYWKGRTIYPEPFIVMYPRQPHPKPYCDFLRTANTSYIVKGDAAPEPGPSCKPDILNLTRFGFIHHRWLSSTQQKMTFFPGLAESAMFVLFCFGCYFLYKAFC